MVNKKSKGNFETILENSKKGWFKRSHIDFEKGKKVLPLSRSNKQI